MKFYIDETPSFKVGDPMPDGYSARHEWAKVHLAAGLQQSTCCICRGWQFPHQLSARIIATQAKTSRGALVKLNSRVCKECDK